MITSLFFLTVFLPSTVCQTLKKKKPPVCVSVCVCVRARLKVLQVVRVHLISGHLQVRVKTNGVMLNYGKTGRSGIWLKNYFSR